MTPQIVLDEPRYQREDFSEFRLIVRQESEDESPPIPIWHLDGVSWADAPAPRRFRRFRPHRHWAQTVVLLKGEEHWRCACGANGGPHVPWLHLSRHHKRFAS